MKHRFRITIWVAVGIVALSACANAGPGDQVPPASGNPLRLASSAFSENGPIPEAYTCDGADISPPLSWAVPPAGTESLALIVDDPDAPVGTWVHWTLFNLAPTTISLPEDVPADNTVLGGALHGSNSWKQVGYGGPCPPKGSTHRYFFKLYALDSTLDLNPGAGKAEIEQAMAGHILAQGELVGRYGR